MSRSSLLLTFLLGSGAVVALAVSCLPAPHDLVGRPCDAQHACADDELVCCLGACQLLSEAALCEQSQPPDAGQDGGNTDGGSLDGGTSDGGTSDGGTSDGGPRDGGAGDAGPGSDAGTDGGCPPNLLATGGFELNEDADVYQDKGSGMAGWSNAYVRTGQGALRVGKDPNDSDPTFGVQLSDTVLQGLEVNSTYCLAAWVNRGNTTADLFLDFTTYHYSQSGSEQMGGSQWTLTQQDNWHLFVGSANLTPAYSRSINFRIMAPYAGGGVFFIDDARVWKSPDGTCPSRCAP